MWENSSQDGILNQGNKTILFHKIFIMHSIFDITFVYCIAYVETCMTLSLEIPASKAVMLCY